jgi:hypothetical protein
MGLRERLGRLLGRKRKEPVRPLTPAEEMKAALAELSVQQSTTRSAGRKKQQRHVDDYRELVLDGTEKVQLSEELLHLTHDTHRNKGRLLEEEGPVVEVTPEDDRSGADAQERADRAAKEFKDYMDKEGIRERTHYYSHIERAQTGEIDRTYDTDLEPRKDKSAPDP